MNAVSFGPPDAPVLVLLHGGGLSWWNYREAARLLEKSYRVVLPILDGHRGSDAPFTTIEDNASRLIAWIDSQFGGRVTALAGLSLGGQIALEMLSQRQDLCEFALIESASAKPMPLTRSLLPASVAMSYPLVRQRWFARLQARYLGIPEALFEDYYRDSSAISREDMTAFLLANSGYRCKSTLSRTTAKVKLLAGSREQKQIRDSAALLHRAIPGSTLELLQGLHHGELSLNRPEEYAKILCDWMASSGETAALFGCSGKSH